MKDSKSNPSERALEAMDEMIEESIEEIEWSKVLLMDNTKVRSLLWFLLFYVLSPSIFFLYTVFFTK